MSIAINTTMLGGNLTRDPELRQIGTDKVVANFSLAINRRYKGNDGEMKEEVTYVECEAWGRTAELVGQCLTKGRACFVSGRLKQDLWEDKDGQKRSKMKVVVDSVQFLDSGNRQTNHEPADEPLPSENAKAPPQQRRPAPASSTDDEPPF